MACRARCIWQVLASLVLLGTGCVGDVNIDDASPRPLLIDLYNPVAAFDLGYVVRAEQSFEVRISEADAETLGAPGTRFEREEGRIDLLVETKFRASTVSGDDLGPCLVDDVVVTNLDTGEKFITIEAGHCIEDQWVYSVEGAYDYLINAGPCTGTVVLDDGREIVTPCR